MLHMYKLPFNSTNYFFRFFFPPFKSGISNAYNFYKVVWRTVKIITFDVNK